MVNVKIKLAALWIAVEFCFVYGDLLRLYSGDFVAGEGFGGMPIEAMPISMELLWLIAAITMTIPIVMIILSLTLKYKANRWANIIVAIFFFAYNLIGLSGGYPSAYDKFLLIVSLVFNVLTVWYAWRWRKQQGQS